MQASVTMFWEALHWLIDHLWEILKKGQAARRIKTKTEENGTGQRNFPIRSSGSPTILWTVLDVVLTLRILYRSKLTSSVLCCHSTFPRQRTLATFGESQQR